MSCKGNYRLQIMFGRKSFRADEIGEIIWGINL